MKLTSSFSGDKIGDKLFEYFIKYTEGIKKEEYKGIKTAIIIIFNYLNSFLELLLFLKTV